MKDENGIYKTGTFTLNNRVPLFTACFVPIPETELTLIVSDTDISDAGKYRVEFVDRKPVLIQVGEV